ncbi:MAG: hypothetical protein ACJ72Z_12635 [Pyrinomonadaceae bacterium]
MARITKSINKFTMLSFLTEPNFPKAAVGIEHDRVTVIALQKQGRTGYEVRNAASVDLPSSLIQPQFLGTNISSRPGLRAVLQEVSGLAGLLGQKNWSVALPSNSARTAILTVEAGGKAESEEVLDWKAEQSFGAPAAHLRISKHRIANDAEGRLRYFASAIKLSVIDEYESVFEELGWRTGLILPRAVCESNWLLNNGGPEDALLLSSQQEGFTAVLFGDGEPSVIRTVSCSPTEKDDEIYRLLMFYNDRFANERGPRQLNRVLTVGDDLNSKKIIDIAREALGREVSILSAPDVGLNIPPGTLGFNELAAPAGLAAFGCR